MSIESIEGRLAAASTLPWNWDSDAVMMGDDEVIVFELTTGDPRIGGMTRASNAAFIAHSRQDVPLLQPFDAKCDAIISLLECVYAHLDYAPGAAKVQHYGDAESPDGTAKAPVCLVATRRWTCWQSWPQYRLIVQLPAGVSEEKWKREYEQLRRQYRIGDVEDSLTRLSRFVPRVDEDGKEEGPDGRDMSQAVWALHVEPWLDPASEPIGAAKRETRRLLAKAGVQWMAHDIRGDVLALGEKPEPIDNEIRRMLADKCSERQIARELRVGRDRIRAFKRALEVRCG